MKIKVQKMPYSEAMRKAKPEHKNPKKPLLSLRFLVKLISKKELKETDFSVNYIGIDSFPDEPCLILMNHSCFLDLQIVSTLLFPKPFAIVCTSDGFVGKEWLMRNLGCIPTNKFVTDSTLLTDISYALKKNKTHVLMYPEASYSFDGCATALPRRMGVLLKLLKVPVVMINTYGAFLHDPLYNMLQQRKVKVTADVRLLASREDLKAKSVEELDAILDEAFSFDSFRWQKENHVAVTEPFRADGLERILFACPYCGAVGEMAGHGEEIECLSCGKKHRMDVYGQLEAVDGETKYPHIPDYYAWERETVRREIIDGTYRFDCKCKILVLRDYNAIYDVGNGHLTHDTSGFTLVSDDGSIHYNQAPTACYGLYADYFWYELGDMICIGTNDVLYYCFPADGEKVPVARARLAAEEMYKIMKSEKKK